MGKWRLICWTGLESYGKHEGEAFRLWAILDKLSVGNSTKCHKFTSRKLIPISNEAYMTCRASLTSASGLRYVQHQHETLPGYQKKTGKGDDTFVHIPPYGLTRKGMGKAGVQCRTSLGCQGRRCPMEFSSSDTKAAGHIIAPPTVTTYPVTIKS